MQEHKARRVARFAAVCVGICLAVCAGAGRADAQEIGVRAGVSGDPDQFYAGVHGEFGPVVEQLYFRPNLEIGVGNDTTLAAINIEFIYKLPVSGGPWSFYVGGGPALIIGRHNGDSDAGGGANIIVGLEHRGGFMTELKVGAVDSPGVKVGVGYTFRR